MPTVLIVEDDPDVRVLAASMIAGLGYETLSAGNDAEALALLESDAAIDVLFTDINMPGHQEGVDLARTAAELRPGIRILYASGAPVTDGLRALFVEGSKFLPKPYTAEQLTAALRALLPPVG